MQMEMTINSAAETRMATVFLRQPRRLRISSETSIISLKDGSAPSVRSMFFIRFARITG